MIEWRIEKYDTISSTQDIIKQRFCEEEGLIIQTINQTAGRGRYNRIWHGGSGNLYLSLMLKPKCKANKIGQLSLLVALSIYKTLEIFIKNTESYNCLTIKWPNDILICNKKCAGILIETELSSTDSCNIDEVSAAFIGIGINILSSPIPESTCLKQHTPITPELSLIIEEFLKQFSKYYSIWQITGFDAIRLEWLRHSHKINEEITIKMPNEIINGHFTGIDTYGNLLLYTQGKQMRISAGEIFTTKYQEQN